MFSKDMNDKLLWVILPCNVPHSSFEERTHHFPTYIIKRMSLSLEKL